MPFHLALTTNTTRILGLYPYCQLERLEVFYVGGRQEVGPLVGRANNGLRHPRCPRTSTTPTPTCPGTSTAPPHDGAGRLSVSAVAFPNIVCSHFASWSARSS